MTESRETHWSGKYLAIHQEGRWEYVSRVRGIGAAVLLAIDSDPAGDHIILVEQYRVPLKANCLELPAGLVGDETAGEAVETAASRELEEETGYRAGRIENLGRFCSSPGMTSETFTMLRASALEKVGEGGGTADENITVHRVALNDIASFVEAKRAEDCVIDVRILLLLGAGMLGA
ncbi:NUDIX hydrolase [Parasphingopyxis lamellibrachiae]|uniref:GDP-mannose pyrophosphatase n=1 Tax=Parasphingopyxis lamellibrachiae TaxID=680125 RepID=A0A3D9FGX8_9SPHN|nr:NUDIX hydrolase [Parasphingopyxis lamellibrachiae]RED16812.1 ADP-ribose pyrophosphatase [Parasphingopyxis lamellibrachiae]